MFRKFPEHRKGEALEKIAKAVDAHFGASFQTLGNYGRVARGKGLRMISISKRRLHLY